MGKNSGNPDPVCEKTLFAVKMGTNLCGLTTAYVRITVNIAMMKDDVRNNAMYRKADIAQP